MSAPRILLLEDDDDLRELLEDMLEDNGFEVETAARGELAVELAGSKDFDLIVADIRMEGMGGLEALERTQNLQPGIGSLIVSGYADELQTARAESLDVGAFVKKPFDMNEFLRLVRKELSSRAKVSTEREKESFYEQALSWCLDGLVRSIDDSGHNKESALKVANLAEDLAESLDCEPNVRLSVRWATIFLITQNCLGEELPEVFKTYHMNLPFVVSLISSVSKEAENPSVEVQIVKLCLAHYFESEKVESRQVEGVSDFVYSKFLEQLPRVKISRKINKKTHSQLPGNRSLLSLAKTLERLGDTENALRAYKQICDEMGPQKERIESWLGQARLALQSKQKEDCVHALRECLKISSSRGPRSLASHGLEAALLLEDLKAKEAAKALSVVAQATKEVDFKLGLALASCAMARLQGVEADAQLYKSLLTHQASQELIPYADWTMRYFFGQAQSKDPEAIGPVLQRLAPDFSSLFLYHFDANRCPSEQRLAITKALSSASYLPKNVLDRLLADSSEAIRKLGNLVRNNAQGQAAVPMIRIQSFGVPRFSCQGENLDESEWRTRKVKYLFFFLASRWGQPISDETIIDEFWPKASSRNRKNLYWSTSGVRSVLKKHCPTLFDPVVRSETHLSLDLRIPRWHDLEVFRESYKAAQELESKGEQNAAVEHYAAAASAYTGTYLDGCHYEFAVDIKRTTEEQALEANSKACDLYLERNQDSLALEYATAAMELDPANEHMCGQKMRALIRMGRTEQALNQYQEFMGLLNEDGPCEAPLELLELYHRARLGFSDA